MMEPTFSTPEERQARAQQKKQAKMYRVAIIILTFLAAGLLASTISLAVIHARYVQRCRAYIPAEASGAPAVPEAPPVGRRSGGDLVVVPVVARTPAFMAPSSKDTIDTAAPLVIRAPTTPIYTNNTNGSSPDDSAQCDPGSVWGGRALDELNHGYMPLMQKALSESPVGVAGDYYHTALRSVFRCGESMEFGQLELIDACMSGYAVDGQNVECNEGGSIGNSTLASV
ncbi:hypothetical protein LA080_016113 [Diaporthe eres]|uniref:Uncharacterized protein n=1 Tax=Diaporthe vaccinii TaxID=105482 RepID=A0ABR4F429_9PEZI|nr:hypothetical protein LA080_016113 [Diaporthe eres]